MPNTSEIILRERILDKRDHGKERGMQGEWKTYGRKNTNKYK
jgi:hypothetical protein